MVRESLRVCALALGATLALASCSSDGSGEPEPPGPTAATASASSATADATTSPVAEEMPYLSVPEDVELTEPGTALEHGEWATIAWRLGNDEIGAAEIRVDSVREVETEEFRGWLAGEALEQARPYYVEVRVQNVGDTDLGDQPVPLYLRDANGTLGPPWRFQGTFDPCPSGPLPGSFEPGDRTRTCLVFLAPRRAVIDSMVFQPSPEFDAITWDGDVRLPGEEPRDRRDERDEKRR